MFNRIFALWQKKARAKLLPVGVAVVGAMLSVLGVAACAPVSSSSVIPYVPPAYYNSTLIMPFDLANAYWSPYITRQDANRDYVGKVYVFKDFTVNGDTLATVNRGYVWADLVKAYPLNLANIKQLKVGEEIDVVGVLSGPGKDYPNTLTFSDCVFLPSGYIDLPVGDSAQFQYAPAY